MSDTELLRELHDQHGATLWRYVLGLTGGDQARAQDVVQETLLRAWRNPHVFDSDKGSPRPWLYTVAKRIVIDQWRADHSRPEIVTDRLPDQPVSDATDHVADRHLVAAALRQLSQDHREVLRECYFRGSSVAQAAQTLGIPAGTVKSRTHYALQALRLAIDELGGVM